MAYQLTHHHLESVNLDPAKISKVHGWNDVSVRAVKICDEFLIKTLFNIYQFSLEAEDFPSKWRAVIKFACIKIIIIINNYNYFEGNDLFSKSQSHFRKGDYCVSQLLSLMHEILRRFDANPS